MSRQNARSITGFPGLSEIAGLRDGTDLTDSKDTLDLVILVTPHLIRYSHPEDASEMLVLSEP